MEIKDRVFSRYIEAALGACPVFCGLTVMD
jgi:hypothetical protein